MRLGIGWSRASHDVTSQDKRGWQWGSLLALGASVGLVVAVQAVEGGALVRLLQVPAALIVFGGTGLATLVSYPPRDVKKAVAAAWRGG